MSKSSNHLQKKLGIQRSDHSTNAVVTTILANSCHLHQYGRYENDPRVLWDLYGPPKRSGICLWEQDSFEAAPPVAETCSPSTLYSQLQYNTPDQRISGRHYSPPKLISSIISRLSGTEQSVVDPSCGTGLFLLAALRKLCKHQPTDKVLHMLYGVDNDPNAIALCRFSLFQQCNHDPRAGEVLEQNIRLGDALIHAKKNPVQTTDVPACFHWREQFPMVFEQGGFEAVIGNPPFLFLSGRGSPVQQLKKQQKYLQANALRLKFETYKKLYPETSQGCRDLYKWFVQLCIELVQENGFIGLILPSSWIRLERYQDLRVLLLDRLSHIEEYGSVFASLTVPTSIIICSPSKKQIQYTDYTAASPWTTWLSRSSEFSLYRDDLTRRLFESSSTTLCDYCIIREGLHQVDKTAVEHGDTIALFQDSLLTRLQAPPVIQIAKPQHFTEEYHKGKRILLRKTGDQLICAPVESSTVVLCHQNCYIIHPNHRTTHLALARLLSSKVLTFLYRTSPMGQQNRPMAQLRISALRKIPVPTHFAAPEIQSVLSKRECGWSDINKTVYNIFKLTREEIEHIEKATTDVNYSPL